jgi:enterochelin esterase family protein
MNIRFALLAVTLCLAAPAIVPNTFGQRRRPEPTPNDTLQSTEIHGDNRVTFRIHAPKAGEVSISGDWVGQGLGEGGELQKDDDGVWSITVGPLPADLYSYSFTVDGVKTLDPKNPQIKPGIRGADNMFFLPGEAAEFEDNQAVPHGVIRQVWYPSTTLGTQRRMHVYTPPGYDAASERYPVLYLLHGGGDEDSGWSTIGRAGFILDNLLAAQKARPMLIVMPNGSLPRPEARADRAATPNADAAARAELQNRFTKELMTDVIPLVEKTFRVQPEPASRAIAGLSMGGGQTLNVLTTHPEMFAYVGIWSAGIFGGNAEQWAKRNENFLADADRVNRAIKLLEIVVGDQDFALDGSKALAEAFEKHGIKHELRITAGGHTWINWRRYLHDLSQKLFQ